MVAVSISRHTRKPPTRAKNFKVRAAKIAYAEDAMDAALASELARHARAITRILKPPQPKVIKQEPQP